MRTNDDLQMDVMDELKWDPQLRDVHTQIGVSAREGVVTLSGLVDSFSKKIAAEKAAQRVKGVKVVACDIEIKLDPFTTRTDTEIAEAVKSALKWNSALDEDKIEAKVDNGWVTLEGEADWTYQKMSAQNNVESLAGIRGITNNIRVNAKKINTTEIRNRISAAFHRNAALDANAIQFEVSGSRVTLTGIVSSSAEKEAAEKIAWTSPGVMVVDNKITIDSEVFA
jgi:osmotically-inducible protein OsmY